MSKSSMKTTLGYEIENFHRLAEPVERGILPPLIYGGLIKKSDVMSDVDELTEKDVLFCTWVEHGHCPNHERPDFFINIKEIPVSG